MKTDHLQQIMSWVRSTDLVEVSFSEGPHGFSLTTADSAPPPQYPAPVGRFTPVAAPAVGLFQWSELGRARRAEEGASVEEGQTLGVVESGKGKPVAVKAPCAGRVARIFVEGGAAVEYGQPLLFLEARG